jgi:hypothetical protein
VGAQRASRGSGHLCLELIGAEAAGYEGHEGHEGHEAKEVREGQAPREHVPMEIRGESRGPLDARASTALSIRRMTKAAPEAIGTPERATSESAAPGLDASPAPPTLTLDRRDAQRALFGTTAIVSALGLGAEVFKAACGVSGKRGFVPMFSLSYEQNVPTWYASALLFTCSLLLAFAARASGRGQVKRWWLLAAAFLYISIDETAEIHEQASAWFSFSGVLYFGWVIPAAAVVLALGAAYLRFLAALPRRTRLRFIVSGAIYVTGALLFELPLGAWTSRHGTDNLGYALIDWVEETLELTGLCLFILALLDHLGSLGVHLGFSRAPASGEDP